MCWLCGCADHVGPGNNIEDKQDTNPVNDIMDS